MQEYLSVTQACAALGGISKPTLYSWVNRGLINKYRMPGTRRTFFLYQEICKAMEQFEPIAV